MEGIFNVRDLGGYPVHSAGKPKRIKRGLIYRSEGPAGMTAGDRKTLEDRKIVTVADFRAPEEKSALFTLTGAGVVELPIDAGNLMGYTREEPERIARSGFSYNSSAEGAAAEMLRLYGGLPDGAAPRYRELFALLSDPARTPLLFHCSAGKDRTGLAAALLLHALGADREVIMADYLESTELLRPYWEPHLTERPYMVPYLTVREEYLLAAFRTIEGRGGLDRYITVELGADLTHLRSLYTEHILDP
jgi:protein-tyrosine phosphatase